MWCLEDFVLGPRIGLGAFGEVRLAKERGRKAVVALKIMRKRRIERLRIQRHIAHEIEIQGHLRHPGVLRLFGFFWDTAHIYLILEHASHGDLASELKRQPDGHFGDDESACYMREVTDAIAYCHSVHVMHRDIKPQNILKGHYGSLKLADFGWAAHTLPCERRWTLCGTLDYLPPEMVHVTHGHSFSVDVWALGILAYELLVGEPPFVGTLPDDTYRRILAASPVFPGDSSAVAEVPSAPARDFVRTLLRRDPDARPLAKEALAHSWLAAATGVANSAIHCGDHRKACGVHLTRASYAAGAGGA